MIHFTDHGTGIPIVWIHGFPLSGRIFDRQLAIRGARHIVPDLPGFGASPAKGSASMESYAREVLALIDHLQIERAVFAGFSMGGYILLELARQARQRFLGAILIDTREVGDTEEGRAGRETMIANVRKSGVSAAIDAMLPKMLAGEHQPDEPLVRQIMEQSTEEGVIAALQAMKDRPDSTSTLRGLAVPLLIVVGDSDPITPPADAKRMGALAQRSRIVEIPDAAHLSNLQRAEEFNAAVERFLNEQVAGSLQS